MMEMTRRIFLLLLLLLPATSCSRDDGALSMDVPERAFTVAPLCGDAPVKGIPCEDDETRVGSVQVFVYYEDELIINERSDSSAVTFLAHPGTYVMYVLCNAPALMSGISHEADLLSQATLLSDNDTTSLVMFNLPGERVFSFDDNFIPVRVGRVAARVRVRKVVNACLSDYLTKQDFVLKDIRLTNVAGDCALRGTAEPELWYNRLGYQGELPSLTYRSVESPVAWGDSLCGDWRLYGYPNPTAEDTTDVTAFSPRFTRLVVRADIGGEEFFYPVSMPGMLANTAYDLEIYIRRNGSKSEENLLLFDEIVVYSDTLAPFGDRDFDDRFIGKVMIVFNNDHELNPYDYVDKDDLFLCYHNVPFVFTEGMSDRFSSVARPKRFNDREPMAMINRVDPGLDPYTSTDRSGHKFTF